MRVVSRETTTEVMTVVKVYPPNSLRKIPRLLSSGVGRSRVGLCAGSLPGQALPPTLPPGERPNVLHEARKLSMEPLFRSPSRFVLFLQLGFWETTGSHVCMKVTS